MKTRSFLDCIPGLAKAVHLRPVALLPQATIARLSMPTVGTLQMQAVPSRSHRVVEP